MTHCPYCSLFWRSRMTTGIPQTWKQAFPVEEGQKDKIYIHNQPSSLKAEWEWSLNLKIRFSSSFQTFKMDEYQFENLVSTTFIQKQIISQLAKPKPELLQDVLSATGCEWNFLLPVPIFTYCYTAQLFSSIYHIMYLQNVDTKSGPDEGIWTKSYFDLTSAFSQQWIWTL